MNELSDGSGLSSSSDSDSDSDLFIRFLSKNNLKDTKYII